MLGAVMTRLTAWISCLFLLACESAPEEREEDTGPWDFSCVESQDLPPDPLVESALLKVPQQASTPNIIHLLDLAYDAQSERVYSAGYGGLYLFDLEGNSPSLLGYSNLVVELHKLERLDSDRVAVTNRDEGLGIVDVSDASSPTYLSLVSLADASGMAWTGSHLLVATHTGAIVSFVVDDEGQAEIVGELSGLGHPWEIALSGDWAYVADNSLGLGVVDISDPAAPELVGTVALPQGAQDLVVDGDRLYVATGASGVSVLSLEDPAQPELIASVETGSSVVSVDVADGLLWATDHAGLLAFDLSETEPAPLAFEETQEWAMHVVADGNRALVADWSRLGVYTLDTEVEAPVLDLSQEEIYLDLEGGQATLSLTNRGAADLQLLGAQVDDGRIALTFEAFTVAPGDTTTILLDFTGDGEGLEATLCLSTNDPDRPLSVLTVASSSAGSSSIAVGEPAVDFVLDDLDGEAHQLALQLGKPVVLVYFATW